MSIKLVALDIDGTLIDENSNISQANERAVKKMVESGIQIALVTGRHLEGVKDIIKTLGIREDTHLVLNNGALVYSRGQILGKDFLSPKEADEVIDFCTKIPGVATTVFHPESIDFHCNPPINQDWLLKKLEVFSMKCRNIAKDPEGLIRQDVAKIMLITDTEKKAFEILQKWPKHLSHLKCTRSYPYLCEINSSTCDKGNGLKMLCENLGILPEEVLAVGDGGNDVPMLRFAKNAVFVRRSAYMPKLPSHVEITPKGHENKGAAWAIQKYLGI